MSAPAARSASAPAKFLFRGAALALSIGITTWLACTAQEESAKAPKEDAAPPPHAPPSAENAQPPAVMPATKFVVLPKDAPKTNAADAKAAKPDRVVPSTKSGILRRPPVTNASAAPVVLPTTKAPLPRVMPATKAARLPRVLPTTKAAPLPDLLPNRAPASDVGQRNAPQQQRAPASRPSSPQAAD